MGFDEAYRMFIESHRKVRKGERLRRLDDGHGHAEHLFLKEVWWPVFRQFENLHPEYEIYDYKDGFRYIDFAYILPYFRVAIEIDGFGPHFRNISAWKFDDHCLRQNYLVIDGWYVIRFTYNQIKEQPRLCQQTVQQFFGRWLSNTTSLSRLTTLEREIVRLASRHIKPVSPKEICEDLGIGSAYAHRLLHNLIEKNWLEPASGSVRVRSYKLHPSRNEVKL
ncbi:DNA-binding response regulator [Alicyclobacillus sp. SO9]|uniref:DNA-binding response regulator n=1 Tax=Alicyclobacillus sp. SO9 TaxID=2665646 RepID=UPI0018E897DF|nr:DNA-binding response regulator [Alicyclobacillus sp. SO9]QQE81256.1 DNA-binding response regulator [Alicyclobacillus sp. SO9]